jgi:hypothetical protein
MVGFMFDFLGFRLKSVSMSLIVWFVFYTCVGDDMMTSMSSLRYHASMSVAMNKFYQETRDALLQLEEVKSNIITEIGSPLASVLRC